MCSSVTSFECAIIIIIIQGLHVTFQYVGQIHVVFSTFKQNFQIVGKVGLFNSGDNDHNESCKDVTTQN